jgi:hypothetical protein
MNRNQRCALAATFVLAGSLAAGSPANAAALQISGTAAFDSTGQCPELAGFTDYPPIVMSGDLDGCWYTNIESAVTKPSGVYLESGEETFVGSLGGGATGTFTTTYKFEAKLAADGSEIWGRCQHPLVNGSGTGGFEGLGGRVNFKDIIGSEGVTYVYRGHIG